MWWWMELWVDGIALRRCPKNAVNMITRVEENSIATYK